MTASTVTPARVPMRPLRREVPRLDSDYSTAARQRTAFLAGTVGVAPEHVGRYSFDPAVLAGCYGSGQVHKFAEIVAATVLCGEVSLGAAVVADEWVTAHERLGRNRP